MEGAVDHYPLPRAVPRMGDCVPEIERMPTRHRTPSGEAVLDARARGAALTVYREDLVDIILALAAAFGSGSPERFAQASHDAAGGIRRAADALDVADLEHQLHTGRLLFSDREI